MSSADLTTFLDSLKQLANAQPASAGDIDLDQEAHQQKLLQSLHTAAGLRPSAALSRRLRTVLERIPAEEVELWIKRISHVPDHPELQSLIEDITNHETYFFRDHIQLEALFCDQMPDVVKRKARSGERTLKLWSAACATGEEAYTLAIMATELLRAQGEIEITGTDGKIRWNGWQVQVHGTDISRQAVAFAKQASYRVGGLGPFRQLPAGMERYFADQAPCDALTPLLRRPIEAIRNITQFRTCNLISAKPPVQGMDVVLCRNVLIYIDPALHGHIQTMLSAGMRTGGMLVMSPVDRDMTKGSFVEHWHRRCVIHEKRSR
ncbi:MAG: hypothetical protein P1U64_06105 [Alcanivoracaceae bacterium]|nr:hypothetical protein [Alcanivoracaceae bacterium]